MGLKVNVASFENHAKSGNGGFPKGRVGGRRIGLAEANERVDHLSWWETVGQRVDNPQCVLRKKGVS
jgi:hypothetical protein